MLGYRTLRDEQGHIDYQSHTNSYILKYEALRQLLPVHNSLIEFTTIICGDGMATLFLKELGEGYVYQPYMEPYMKLPWVETLPLKNSLCGKKQVWLLWFACNMHPEASGCLISDNAGLLGL